MTSLPAASFASYFLLGPGRENYPAEAQKRKKNTNRRRGNKLQTMGIYEAAV